MMPLPRYHSHTPQQLREPHTKNVAAPFWGAFISRAQPVSCRFVRMRCAGGPRKTKRVRTSSRHPAWCAWSRWRNGRRARRAATTVHRCTARAARVRRRAARASRARCTKDGDSGSRAGGGAPHRKRKTHLVPWRIAITVHAYRLALVRARWDVRGAWPHRTDVLLRAARGWPGAWPAAPPPGAPSGAGRAPRPAPALDPAQAAPSKRAKKRPHPAHAAPAPGGAAAAPVTTPPSPWRCWCAPARRRVPARAGAWCTA